MSEIENVEFNGAVQPFIDIIKQVMELPEEGLTLETMNIINDMIKDSVSEIQTQQAVQEVIKSFKNFNFSKGEARENIRQTIQALNGLIDAYDPSEKKRSIIQKIFSPLTIVFEAAIEQYMSHDFILPMSLEEGAREPTYAHDTDAAADLYAAQDMVLAPHSLSNMVNTGVRLELPEGWMAVILPRSSMGAKTGLRLSNSAGIIDSDYRGPLGVLYDNVSDSEYKITAGDRIAQLLVLPSYRFKAKIVDSVNETERGEGGFGSSGK